MCELHVNRPSRPLLTAHIITVGDELLIGQVVNTNAAWIGDQLAQVGISCTRTVTVGDNATDIIHAADFARRHADVCIVTGGLGPTHDDVTREAIAELFGKTLSQDDNLLKVIERRFASRGREMAPSNASQALVPEGFGAIENDRGTAPGLHYDYQFESAAKILFVVPGVPREMKSMMTREIIPSLVQKSSASFYFQKTLQTAGIGESALAQLLGDIVPANGGTVGLAFLPKLDGVRLRLQAKAVTESEAQKLVLDLESRIREIAGRFIYAEGQVKIEEAVGDTLRTMGLTVSAAESCTGGLVASRLTDVAGASAYFKGSIVAYSNDVKLAELGVVRSDLDEHGAVSEPVVRKMARGACEMFGTTIGLASSGIMGPGGGTEEKPVGTVWLAVHGQQGTTSRRIQLAQDREINKLQAATALLDMLRRYLGKASSA